MDDKAFLALIAAGPAIGGGLLTTVLGPVIKHYLEQASVNKAHKREQIQRWRALVIELHRESGGDLGVGSMIEKHPDFLSLEPHLTEQARHAIYSKNIVIVDDQTLANPLEVIKNEISRIEGSWGLRE